MYTSRFPIVAIFLSLLPSRRRPPPPNIPIFLEQSPSQLQFVRDTRQAKDDVDLMIV